MVKDKNEYTEDQNQEVSDQQSSWSQDDLENEEQKPAVAESGNKGKLVVIIVGVVVLFLLYSIFTEEEQKPSNTVNVEDIVQKAQGPVGSVASRSSMPLDIEPPMPPAAEMASVPPPPPPPPPPAPPVIEAPPPIESPNKVFGGFGAGFTIPKEIEGRIKSKMFVSGSGGGSGGMSRSENSGFFGGGSSSSRENVPSSIAASLAPSSAVYVDATLASDPRYTIGMGKIMDAVLETGINTQLPGILRAVISQDVYAEQGRAILIPRGSRLIGVYDTEISRGQGRVFITWNRVIRPDGIDIMIDSPAADLLGRAGMEGEVDSRYLEIFSNSILLSTLSVAFAVAGDEIVDGGSVTQGETGSGDATQSGSVGSIALLDAVDDFGNTVEGVARDLIDISPIITVDQGTRIKVFANKDIKFPTGFGSGVEVIR